MSINKNISVWRGDDTPPTDYHIWIKSDGTQQIKINGSYITQYNPNIGDTINISSLKNDWNISTSNIFQWLATEGVSNYGILLHPGIKVRLKNQDGWKEYIYSATDDLDYSKEQNWKELESGSGIYESFISDKDLTLPNTVGGISKGTSLKSLEGKTYAQIFDDLLFPTIYPTFTDPSASIKWNGYNSTQEVGAIGPTVSNFTTGYSAGQITLNGVKQANRGGSQNKADSFIFVNNSINNKTLPAKVTLGNTTFKYRAAFTEGPQPKNNKGGDYDSSLAAGTVDSNAITLNGTFPWYASTVTAGTLTKQPLVTWNAIAGTMATGEFEVRPHTPTAPQMFKLPRKASSLEMYSTVSSKYETVKLSDWTETSVSESINGTSQIYYVYSYKGSARSSVKLKVKF